jgi:hypothetical protein
MSKQELYNLATIEQLKAEPGARAVGLVESARKRLVAPVIENDGNF